MVYHGQSWDQVVEEAVAGYADLEQRLEAVTGELGVLEELVRVMRAEVEGGGL